MENKIICKPNMFSLNQTLFLSDGSSVSVKTDTLGQEILNFCNQENLNKIILYGNEEYLNGLKEQIYMLSKLNYKTTKIEVEIKE